MRTPGNLMRRDVYRNQLKDRTCKDQKAKVEWNKLVQQKKSRLEAACWTRGGKLMKPYNKQR